MSRNIPANPVSRYTDTPSYVRTAYSEDVADFLLSGTGFTVTRDAPMGAKWRETFEALVTAGYMRRSQTGRYYWAKRAAAVVPAGPGLVQWHIYDLQQAGAPVVRSGSQRYPAGATQAETDEAWAHATADARSVLAGVDR